jgi:hypothetical protein
MDCSRTILWEQVRPAQMFRKTDAFDDLKNAKYVVDKIDMNDVSVNVYGATAVAFTKA